MVSHRVRPLAPVPLDFDAIRAELSIPGPFPPAVLAAADEAAASRPATSDDATDLDLVTIDPPGSMDLDQAVGIEATPDGGWIVRYAIADVASWVTPGGAIDVEARARTQTYYAPDHRVPLHPDRLGEGAASLLPDGPRPAALWTIEVNADGTTGTVDLRRAMVRSRARLDYAGVQAALDAGDAPACIAEFPRLGAALLADARRRHAIELGLPEQQVVQQADGTWTVTLRKDLPVESWNAQVSLLTGRAAAGIMLAGGIGILRTLPAAPQGAVDRLRRAAKNLGITWPKGADPGAVLAALDLDQPRHAAFADLAGELLRGAGYTTFRGTPPEDHDHAGIGGPYAHVTAPLRRLVDRFATEVCLALHAGEPVPAWVDEALDTLPDLMREGDGRAKKLDRSIVDATEAFVLQGRVGDTFPAEVIESGDDYGTIVVDDPAIRARCNGRDLPLGETIQVRCVTADVATRTVRFERVT